ncbi:MAG: DUF742 domain-containing protein [Pseudonocardiaceae bacterium]
MGKGQHRRDPVVGLTGARFGGAAGRRLRQTEPPIDEEPVAATPPPDEDQPIVGQTGARFAGSGSRDRSSVAPLPPIEQAQPVTIPESAPHKPREDAEWVVDETEWVGSEENYDLVRPYSRTGGRTAPSENLAVEVLISASGRAPDPAAAPEHHAILGLCRTPRSVAELAALLPVPLGVARVVLADMIKAGSIVVHRTVGSAEGAPDLALMQRVLNRLQRL